MIKKIFIFIAVFIAVIFFANFTYFTIQFKYFFTGKTVNPNKTSIAVPEGKKLEPNFLEIKRLDIQAPVVYEEKVSEDAFQKALLVGVVHYPGTALPGKPGNCYIFGHSSDYIWSKGKYKTIFALLPKMENGETIQISNSAGEIFTYKVFESLVVLPTDTRYLSQDTGQKILTIQTSYPIGTALRRYLVRARLVE